MNAFMKQLAVSKNNPVIVAMFIFQVAALTLNAIWVTQAANAQTTQAQPNLVPPGDASTQANSSALEPKALDLLKAMSDRLAAAQTMTFTAISTYESPSRLGPSLTYTTSSEVTLQRPDKLQVISPGDGPASEFYYNGKTMMAYAPAENLLAVAEAPPTIDAALEAAYTSAAIYFPFTDVIVADPYGDIANSLKVAFYIGQSQVVGETTTDMIAIANDKVFAQVWIGASDHLPRMIRAVYADDPLRLHHQVEFTDWQLDVPIAAGTFASSRTDGAKRIPFTRPAPPDTSPVNAK